MNNDFVAETATRFHIPGAAVGVLHDGRERFFCHGVTNVENPLPVNEDTLFLLGSVTRPAPPPRSCGWSRTGAWSSTRRSGGTCRS
jgi:hypothetical protein